MSDTATLSLVLLLIIFLLIGILYANSKGRRKITGSVIIIQEGRMPGDIKSGIVCPHCGHKFKHTAFFEGELVKCPYCGNEIA